MKLRHALLATLLALCGTRAAHAGHVYIPAAQFQPCIADSATQNTSGPPTTPDSLWWTFASGADQCVTAVAFVPASIGTTPTFTPTLLFEESVVQSAKKIRMGVSFIAAPVGYEFVTVTGAEATAVPLGIGFTTSNSDTGIQVLPQASTPLQNPDSAACTVAACANMLMRVRIQRVETNAVCLGALTPYLCCTGASTGTCEPSAFYTHDVNVFGVDLAY